MFRLLLLWFVVMTLAAACSSPNAFSKSGRQAYRADICGQYLSPQSTTPNYAGRGRSFVVQSRNQ